MCHWLWGGGSLPKGLVHNLLLQSSASTAQKFKFPKLILFILCAGRGQDSFPRDWCATCCQNNQLPKLADNGPTENFSTAVAAVTGHFQTAAWWPEVQEKGFFIGPQKGTIHQKVKAKAVPAK